MAIPAVQIIKPHDSMPPRDTRMTTTHGHETLVARLAQILIRLNQGETLMPKALADEFQVHPRTIHRDLNERFAYLPLKKEGDGYRLESFYLGKLSATDIQQFAAIAGIKGLFPSLDNGFLKSVLDASISQAYLVKGHRYENPQAYQHLFHPLETAILQHLKVRFTFSGKLREGVAPYRLLNYKGVWYLVAVESSLLKAFRLAEIAGFSLTTDTFMPDAAIQERVLTEEGIWFSETRREVVLKVDAAIVPYFQRRPLLPEQQIDKILEDGSLIVSARVGHASQVLPIVRYWIPHVSVISPEEFRQSLLQSLTEYQHREGV
jgi:predicted DNA-binding transcriptional regulator YafY